MTNQQLLNRSQALQRAAERVQTTRMRYAVQKNLRVVQSALEPYQDTLKQLADEHGVELNGEMPDDEDFQEDLDELLQQDAGDVEAYTVPPETLDREDEQGTDLPIDVISALDWMIK